VSYLTEVVCGSKQFELK